MSVFFNKMLWVFLFQLSWSLITEEQAFKEFIEQQNRNYSSQKEYSYRFEVFKQNLKLIQANDGSLMGQLKGKVLLGTSDEEENLLRLGMNQFGDLTEEEFKHSVLMPEIPDHKPSEEQTALKVKTAERAASKGALASSTKADRALQSLKRRASWKQFATPVKNQKDCASCYAFAAIAALEARYKQKTGKTVTLSEQEIVDCETVSSGCKGGFAVDSAKYILKNKISFEKNYPYSAKDGKCKGPTTNKNANRVSRFSNLKSITVLKDGNLEVIKALQNGPVSICLYFPSTASLRFYKSGVYDGADCKNGNKPTHCVLAVGYDLSAKPAYIEFKNSWGLTWGDKGYFKLALGTIAAKSDGICNIGGGKHNFVPNF